MRSTFDQSIKDLVNDINTMGSRVDRILEETTRALRDHDFILAKEIFDNDHYINAMEGRIERECFNLIALQQPIASDLRIITASLKIVTDIERIGDQCADICEIMVTYPEFHVMKTPALILRMLEKAREMFIGSIDAFVRKDVELAKDVAQRDDIVDEMFSRAVIELTQVLQQDSNLTSQATDYLYIAKYIERIADHATNISEWAAYQVTNEHKDMNIHDGQIEE